MDWSSLRGRPKLLRTLSPQSPSAQLIALERLRYCRSSGRLELGAHSTSRKVNSSVVASLLRLDPFLVGKINFNRALLAAHRCPPQGWTLIVRDSESSSIFVAGQLLRPSDCIVLDAGTEIELLCHGASHLHRDFRVRGGGGRSSRDARARQIFAAAWAAQLVSCGNAAALRNLPDPTDRVEAVYDVTRLPCAF